MNVAKIKTGIVETNTYFLSNDNNDCIVIDPGDDIPGIMNYLTDNNLRLLYVLLTHAHFDHCNAARALQMNGAKIYMHKKDYPLVKSDDNLASKFGVLFNKFTPDGFVKDNQHLNIADSDI